MSDSSKVFRKNGPRDVSCCGVRGKFSQSQLTCGNGDTLKQRKMAFDDCHQLSEMDRFLSQTLMRLGAFSTCDYAKHRSFSTLSIKSSIDYLYFCDWHPELFAIDEDIIPSSEDEEGVFDEMEKNVELEERANALTSSDLDYLRKGSRENFTDEQLRTEWKRNQIPRYGRRARAKPILERENQEKFECICNIDRSYSRHYIPNFGGGVKNEGEDWKTPHFVAFWENYREQIDSEEMVEWSKLFENRGEEVVQEKSAYFRPMPKFPGFSVKDIKDYREQLLASFRPLTCREIRRYRMPYAEALYLELQEDLYLNSAAFFKEMLVKDHLLHLNPQFNGPLLRQSKGKMNKIVAFLKIAERFSRKQEYHKEAVILLRSGKYFNEHDKNWWWLAEEFYTQAVTASEKSVIDGGKSEAVARYILGVFLLDCVSRVQLAQEHLSKARELSLGKDWNAERILNRHQEPVYKECGNYLCRALIAASRELRKNGKPDEALPLIHRSHKLCQEAGSPKRDVEMETYFELGMTYQEVGMLNWAKVAFRKFIEIAKLEGYPKSICDGYLELAICFRSEGDLVRCYNNLVNYLETAEKNGDVNLIAYGHRYLGEYHLNNEMVGKKEEFIEKGNAKLAAEFFRKSFESFHLQFLESSQVPFEDWKFENFNLPQDVELTRVLVGLAEGEMFTKPICHLILQARDAKNQKEAEKLMKWKNRRDVEFQLEESKCEELNFVMEPDNTQIQLGRVKRESQESSEELLGEVSDFRTVRFALDVKKSTIIL